ncbi:MAG: polymer-forming cytoskeletal protein [Alphaproteobacteria bacterium]|nr:polymer-forming cytoskeletal protein [Alphaproteobacteria bacterium]
MFNKKANSKTTPAPASKSNKTRELIPSIITPDVHLLGNLVSEGAVDFSGTIDGNIRCETLTLRAQGTVKGEITANTVQIQGTVKGLIRAKNVHLHATCKVEGIIIHEQLSIEDGAFVDGKFKRSDRVIEPAMMEETAADDAENDGGFNASTAALGRATAAPASSSSGSNVKVLENIRLIR